MKIPSTLSGLALTALASTAADASTWNASASLQRFDEAITQGLPQSISAVRATNDEGVATAARLAVASRLETVVELPDGTLMRTYLGSWNGMPATISRGDGQLWIDADE